MIQRNQGQTFSVYNAKRISNRTYDIFGFFFAISFILNGYDSGLPGISLGSLLFLLLIALCILFRRIKLGKITGTVLVFIVCLLLFSSIGFAVCGIKSVSGYVVGIMKLTVWSLMISIVAKYFYDNHYIKKWLVIVGVILTIYIIVQTLFFYVLHIYLPNIFNIGFLKPYDEGYADYDTLSNVSILRPGSFLSESSFYGNYMICSLAVVLGTGLKEMKKKDWLTAAFFSLGIIVSTSTSAIVFLALIWLVFLIASKSVKTIVGVLTFAVLFIALSFILLPLNPGFSNALRYAFNKFTYLDQSSRFGKSFSYLDLLTTRQFVYYISYDIHV